MTAPKKGPTPLTDAVAKFELLPHRLAMIEIVPACHARKLERDRARLVAALKADLDEWRQTKQNAGGCTEYVAFENAADRRIPEITALLRELGEL